MLAIRFCAPFTPSPTPPPHTHTQQVCCAYAGVLARLAVCYGGYLWFVLGDLPQNDPPPETQARIAPTLVADALDGGDKMAALPAYTTLVSVFAFAWPLALVNSAQKASRPLVNLAVSRSATGAGGIAVLTVCYPIVHALYGWLDELKTVFPVRQPPHRSVVDHLSLIFQLRPPHTHTHTRARAPFDAPCLAVVRIG